jgi:hypothetical protein
MLISGLLDKGPNVDSDERARDKRVKFSSFSNATFDFFYENSWAADKEGIFPAAWRKMIVNARRHF